MRLISFKKFKENCKWNYYQKDFKVNCCFNVSNGKVLYIKDGAGGHFVHHSCEESICPVLRDCKKVKE